ncbi:MAG: hypothetical protein ACKO96_39480 [Flammeovirgaceae bacterium]
MNFYKYIFSCAYWVSVKELKESKSPQEYAFMFLFFVDLFLFVTCTGIINLIVGRNILNGMIVILSSTMIAGINYLIFLREKQYEKIIERFKEVEMPEFKARRVRTLILTFSVAAILAICVAILNNPSRYVIRVLLEFNVIPSN